MQTTFDAIVLAGYDRDKVDALTEQTGQPHKALMPIAGKPMVWHVVNALTESASIGRVVIVGLSAEDGVDFGREIDYLPDKGSIFENTAQAFEHLATMEDTDRHALLVSADIPLMKGAMIDWFIDQCSPYDLDVYWGVTEQRIMEQTFPDSQRTYIRLVEGRFCNGELYLGRIEAALGRQELFRDMIASRKNIFKQVRMLGLGMVLKFLFRRLTFDDLTGVAWRMLQLRGGQIILPFAETGMDIDKPHHLELTQTYLAQHGSESAWLPPG